MVIKKEFKNLSLIFSIILLLALSIFIIRPIMQPLILGLLLAYIFYPLYKKMQTRVKSKNLRAAIIVLLVIVVVGLPLWFLIPVAVKQAFNIYLYIQKIDLFNVINKLIPSLATTNLSKDLVLSLNKFIVSMANKFFVASSNFLFNLPLFLLKVTVCLFVLFFGLRDDEYIKNFIKTISPFPKNLEKSLFNNFDDITKSVIYGFILIGLLQGILTGVGLFVFKVPQALFLTFIAIIACVIPIVGAWIVWIPASIYLFISGKVGAGIGLFLYGALFISWIDNLMRPYFVSKRSKISTALVFIGMTGGLVTLGLIGVVIGPLILSYLSILLKYYKDNSNNNKE